MRFLIDNRDARFVMPFHILLHTTFLHNKGFDSQAGNKETPSQNNQTAAAQRPAGGFGPDNLLLLEPVLGVDTLFIEPGSPWENGYVGGLIMHTLVLDCIEYHCMLYMNHNMNLGVDSPGGNR